MQASQHLIDVESLRTKLGDDTYRVIDCRFDLSAPDAGEAAYLQAHIPGAVYAHLDRDLSGAPVTDCGRHPMPAPQQMKQTFERMGISNTTPVVAYDDQGGMIAARAWWMLRYLGHKEVALLNGGWGAWHSAGAPTRTGEEHYPPGTLTISPVSDRLVTHAQLDDEMLLVDAREPRRFRGEFEPIDARAGHIPGASNHFFANNIDETKRFLSPDQMKAGFKRSLGRLPDEQTVHYCGSGVSACHNIFAQVYAGLAEPRLYGGSWSEWAKLAAESEGADV